MVTLDQINETPDELLAEPYRFLRDGDASLLPKLERGEVIYTINEMVGLVRVETDDGERGKQKAIPRGEADEADILGPHAYSGNVMEGEVHAWARAFRGAWDGSNPLLEFDTDEDGDDEDGE